MNNNERFISSFKELEDFIINLCKKTDYLFQYIESTYASNKTNKYSFGNCINSIYNWKIGNSSKVKTVRLLGSKIVKINEKKDFINKILNIRNKLSHEIWWFEVTNDCIVELDKLCDFLFRIKIKDTEKIPKIVTTCNERDSLQDILKIMTENKYTHIPIISDTWEIMGIVSDALITMWLREQINSDGEIVIDTKSVTLWAIVGMRTEYEEYLFLSDTELTSKAYSKFEEYILKWNRLWCIIFTKDWEKTSSVTWIMTAWDLPIIKEYFIL